MLGGFFSNLVLPPAVQAYDLMTYYRAEFCGEIGLPKKIESSLRSISTSSISPWLELYAELTHSRFIAGAISMEILPAMWLDAIDSRREYKVG